MNDLQFTQASTLLNAINSQMMGKETIAPVNTTEFVSVATTMLKQGTEPILNAVSQVLARTIFSSRTYSAKLNFLTVSEQEYGNHVRKINFLDSPVIDDPHYNLTDGQSVDMFKVYKPKVLQTNFYGADTFMIPVTIFQDQLNVAFRGPEEFMQFVAGILNQVNTTLEQMKDAGARALLANFMAGKIKKDGVNVIHLVTLYNDETGLALTSDTVKQVENFKPFIEWLYSKIQTTADFMTERSYKFHMNIEDAETPVMIPRHTDYVDQRLIMLAGTENEITSRVLANVFNDEKLKLAQHDKINFWQSIDAPSGISVSDAAVMNPATGATVATGAVTQSNILGILYDKDAMGITYVLDAINTSPINAVGRYYNQVWHITKRWWEDLTENAVIFVLD